MCVLKKTRWEPSAAMDTYPLFGQKFRHYGTQHAWESTDPIGETHQNAGEARSYVQMVHIETCKKERGEF